MLLLCSGVLEGYIELGSVEGVAMGDDGGRREESNRVARFLMLTNSGRSLED